MTVKNIAMRSLAAALLLVICYYPLPSACFLAQGCGSIPREKGNFKFVAQEWPKYTRRENQGTKEVMINCSTNDAAASVTLEYAERPMAYRPYQQTLGYPPLVQNGQFFTMKGETYSPTTYRCIGELSGQKICLPLGILYFAPAPVMEVTIFPPIDPIYKTEGEYLEFKCETQGSCSKKDSVLKWYKKTAAGNVQVNSALTTWNYNNMNRRCNEEFSVRFNPLRKIHSGLYICTRNTGQKAKVQVVVKDATKPEVKLDPSVSEIKVIDGQNKRIEVVCRNAGGSPKPKKEWRNPRGEVVHSCDVHSDTCTLNIWKATHAKHHGRYTCVATNLAGTTKLDVFINVLMKVELQQLLPRDVAGYDENALLMCKVKKANPLPTIVWYYQDWSCVSPTKCQPTDQGWKKQFPMVSLTPSSTNATAESRLIVPPSISNAFYSCQATNALGTDVYNVTLFRLCPSADPQAPKPLLSSSAMATVVEPAFAFVVVLTSITIW